MALFKKDGGAKPIANKISYQADVPLTGGDAYATRAIMDEMPFKLGNKDYTTDLEDNTDYDVDDKFNPNLFGRWADVYNAWIGNYQLVEAPEEIKRLELAMMHHLFMSNDFGLYKLNDEWIIGNINIDTADIQGNVITGSFIPSNSITFEQKKDAQIQITEANKDMFINFNLGIFKVPLFVQIKYFINQRTYLWIYKDTNLRVSTLQKLVGIKGKGRELITRQLRKLFNLGKKSMPLPVQTLELGIDTNGKVTNTFEDLKNVIDITIPYRGLELLQDIQGLTTEIMRVAGIRTDLAKNQQSFSDRHTNAQAAQSTSYFDNVEYKTLLSFRNFSYDFKKKFGIELKWDSTYNIMRQESNKEKEQIVKEEKDVKEI